MFFFVRAVNLDDGKQISNLVEHYDYETLLTSLDSKGLIPSSITPVPGFLTPIFSYFSKQVKADDVIELMDNLHLVIKAGLPLYQGILDIAYDTKNNRFKTMLEKIANDVNQGKSLSEAFAVYEDVIGVMILNLIRIGEETGKLEATLKRASEFLKRTTALKRKAKSALIYPTFAFLAVTAAMIVWMVYVLPQMTELFKSMEIQLPPLTIFIMNLSDFMSAYISYMLIGLVIFIIGFKLLHKRYRKVRLFTDKLVLKIPVIKQIVSGFNMAFISEYLQLSLVSGIPVFSSLETLGENLKNEVYKGALQKATKDVSHGSQLSDAFKKRRVFSPFMLRMMSVGEAAGTLDAQLHIISSYYYERVDYYAQNIGKVIEPVVLIFVGAFMTLVIVGLMGPMYDLISNIN